MKVGKKYVSTFNNYMSSYSIYLFIHNGHIYLCTVIQLKNLIKLITIKL